MVISHQFSYVHASFWLEIEQCSIRRRLLVPDKSSPRYASRTYQKPAPEKWSQFSAPVSGACVMGVSIGLHWTHKCHTSMKFIVLDDLVQVCICLCTQLKQIFSAYNCCYTDVLYLLFSIAVHYMCLVFHCNFGYDVLCVHLFSVLCVCTFQTVVTIL